MDALLKAAEDVCFGWDWATMDVEELLREEIRILQEEVRKARDGDNG